MKIIEPSMKLEEQVDGQAILNKLEKIGRVCYKSENKINDESAEKFIAGIINRGHESVLEHVSISVRVICDRGVSHEIVRHRVASYSQESTRYCVAGDTKLFMSNYHNKMTIKELYNNKENSKNGSWKRMKLKQVNEDTGSTEYSKIKDVLFNGTKEVYEINTSLGYTLKCTEDHEIYTPNGYKRLSDLKQGNYVYVNGVDVNSNELYKNREWLYYQSITLNKTFVQIGKEFGFNINTLKGWARKLGIPKKGTGYFQKGRTHWNKGLSEEDPRVKKQAEALRKYHHCGRRKEGIMKEDTSKYLKYNKGYCEICGSKNELDVHHKDENRKNNYPSNLITLCESCHMRVHSKNLTIIHPDEIVSIKKVGLEEVYDISMDSKYHNFSANGIIVHNCNYSNDKFGNELTFIKPSWVETPISILNSIDVDVVIHELDLGGELSCIDEKEFMWLASMDADESVYLSLIEKGWKPQQARSVLPNSIKTELVMTMNLREWRHFFKLRTAAAAHPDMRRITIPFLKELKSKIPVIFDDIEVDSND